MRFPPPSIPLTLALLLGAAPLAAQAPDSAMVAAGKVLFEGRGLCATCHGKQGEGILGPELRLHAGKKWLHSDGSTEALVALVSGGIEASRTRTGIAMPPRGGARLSDAQVRQVVAYVRHLHATTPPPTP